MSSKIQSKSYGDEINKKNFINITGSQFDKELDEHLDEQYGKTEIDEDEDEESDDNFDEDDEPFADEDEWDEDELDGVEPTDDELKSINSILVSPGSDGFLDVDDFTDEDDF